MKCLFLACEARLAARTFVQLALDTRTEEFEILTSAETDTDRYRIGGVANNFDATDLSRRSQFFICDASFVEIGEERWRCLYLWLDGEVYYDRRHWPANDARWKRNQKGFR